MEGQRLGAPATPAAPTANRGALTAHVMLTGSPVAPGGGGPASIMLTPAALRACHKGGSDSQEWHLPGSEALGRELVGLQWETP